VRFTKVWLVVIIMALGSGVQAALNGDVLYAVGLLIFGGLIFWVVWVR